MKRFDSLSAASRHLQSSPDVSGSPRRPMSRLSCILFVVFVVCSKVMAFSFRALGRSALQLSRGATTPSLRLMRSIRLAQSTSVHSAAPGAVTAENGEQEEDNLFGFDLPTNDNSPALLKTRHTTSHIMAMAVQKLYKDAQVTIGPWIDNGFYYDFFIPNQQLSDNELKLIKKEMDKIIKADLPMRREEVTREEARCVDLFQRCGRYW